MPQYKFKLIVVPAVRTTGCGATAPYTVKMNPKTENNQAIGTRTSSMAHQKMIFAITVTETTMAASTAGRLYHALMTGSSTLDIP